MKIAITTFIAAALLAGCQTKQIGEMSYADRQKLAGEIAARCQAAGAMHPSPQFDQCVEVEIQAEDARRQRAAADMAAFRERLSRAGASMQATGAGMMNSARQPATCRTVQGPDGAWTTACY